MFRSSGFLQFDPLPGTKHFVPWWSLLRCEHDIAAYYAWHTNRFGIEVNVANLWGIHISVVKGDTSFAHPSLVDYGFPRQRRFD